MSGRPESNIRQSEMHMGQHDKLPAIPSQRGAGLTQMFGIHPQAAVLTVIVDLMVFTGDTASLETLLPLGVAISAVLGFIVYRIQRKHYGDDSESAFIKATIIALLTAIPAPLSPFIAIPGGLIGIVKSITRK
jgi:chromate transport protein ChrA